MPLRYQRTIHHLACTGGTIISKCLSVMPNTILLSEINPLNLYGSYFCPSNPFLAFQVAYGKPLGIEAYRENFISQIQLIRKICDRDNKSLIIRDHAQHDFFSRHPSQCCDVKTPVRQFLEDYFQLLSALTVRHPLDSYLSFRKNCELYDEKIFTLEEYCKCYRNFLNEYAGITIFKYEDFCRDTIDFMERLSSCLQLEFDVDCLKRFGLARVSGDSGRASNLEIRLRERRVVPWDVDQERMSGCHYQMLLQALDYQD